MTLGIDRTCDRCSNRPSVGSDNMHASRSSNSHLRVPFTEAPEAMILLNGGSLPSRGMDSKFGVLIWLNSCRKSGFGLFLA
jgi:hypothetical protein